MQIWSSDSSLACRVPDGVGRTLPVTASVYGGTGMRTKQIKSLSTANFSAPIIFDATPIDGSHLSMVQGQGIGKMIGEQNFQI